MDPVNAKLEPVVETHIVKFCLDLHLAVDALAYTGQVMLHPFYRRRPISNLNNAGRFIDGQGTFARRGKHESYLFGDFLPEIDRIVSGEVYRRAAAAKGAAAARAAARASAGPR